MLGSQQHSHTATHSPDSCTFYYQYYDVILCCICIGSYLYRNCSGL